jgi:hypothetical protein
VRLQEVFDVAAAMDPRSNRLFPDPKHGPTVTDIEQLKAWAVVEEGEKQLFLEFATREHDALEERELLDDLLDKFPVADERPARDMEVLQQRRPASDHVRELISQVD